jgi:ribonuclease Z
MLTITLLGTGSPLPDPHRAGPSTLVQGGGAHYLVDAGRGVLMRLVAAGVPVTQLSGVLITHLHSDHITDLNDVITSFWIASFTPATLRIVGPPGTREMVAHLLAALGPDIGYRIAHHADIEEGPRLEVTEILDGPVDLDGPLTIDAAPTDHRPVEPSVGYRFSLDGTAVVVAGDTVPCEGLDRLCTGAQALVHTAIRKDIIENIPIARLVDVLDYHSSVEQAAETAERAGMTHLVLTHYVPAFPPGGGDDWRALAASAFSGQVHLGDDLLRVDVGGPAS